MRNKQQINIYPCYFDARRSRKNGRRVNASLAVQKPLLDELKLIADHLKLVYDVDPDAKHPAAWHEENNGRLLVQKTDQAGQAVEKAKLVQKMAKYLLAIKKKKKEKEEQKDKGKQHKPQQSHKKYQAPPPKK
nr:signal recognition particle subunit SRP19/SEC65 family protein [Candidatus Sigynarchaeota archaeon]